MKTFTSASIATALLATAASAQEQYSINPDSVSESLRDFWCQQQQAQCPLICQTIGNSAETISNECTGADLTYSCVCDDGVSPNVTEYSQTLPFFICQEWGNQCVSNCGNGNTGCQSDCRSSHPCGAQSPIRQNTSTLTGTMTRSASSADSTASTTASDGGKVVTTDGETVTLYGLASQTASQTDKSSNAVSHVRVWALSAGQTFGSVALVGAIFGGFAVLL